MGRLGSVTPPSRKGIACQRQRVVRHSARSAALKGTVRESPCQASLLIQSSLPHSFTFIRAFVGAMRRGLPTKNCHSPFTVRRAYATRLVDFETIKRIGVNRVASSR